MSGVFRSVAVATAITVALHVPSRPKPTLHTALFNQSLASLADGDGSGQIGSKPTAGSTRARRWPATPGRRYPVAPAGTIAKQIPSGLDRLPEAGPGPDHSQRIQPFRLGCRVTSGFRPGRRSYHGKCLRPMSRSRASRRPGLRRISARQDGVGGVGTYRHTRSVHLDVADRQWSWHRGGRRRVASLWRDY